MSRIARCKLLQTGKIQGHIWSVTQRASLNLSKDAQYVYFIGRAEKDLLRVRISDHKTERVADLQNFRTTGVWGTGLSLAPDDSPVLLRDAGTQDVYALGGEEP